MGAAPSHAASTAQQLRTHAQHRIIASALGESKQCSPQTYARLRLRFLLFHCSFFFFLFLIIFMRAGRRKMLDGCLLLPLFCRLKLYCRLRRRSGGGRLNHGQGWTWHQVSARNSRQAAFDRSPILVSNCEKSFFCRVLGCTSSLQPHPSIEHCRSPKDARGRSIIQRQSWSRVDARLEVAEEGGSPGNLHTACSKMRTRTNDESSPERKRYNIYERECYYNVSSSFGLFSLRALLACCKDRDCSWVYQRPCTFVIVPVPDMCNLPPLSHLAVPPTATTLTLNSTPSLYSLISSLFTFIRQLVCASSVRTCSSWSTSHTCI